MDPQWDEGSPIYRQLRDRVVAMILEGVLKEGDPLPSVRSVAAEFRLNPLTVLKGYQQLVDENLVEKRRGRGMFVNVGARQALMKDEKQRFLDEEWPKVHAIIVRLGLSVDDLLRVPPARHVAPGGTGTGTSPGSGSGGQAAIGTTGVAAVLRREAPPGTSAAAGPGAGTDPSSFDDGADFGGEPAQGEER